MVSFAQNAEDVVLQRVFARAAKGFYIDVGASVPVEDSVTLHFYRLGWRGVNVEPDHSDYADLCRERKRDININAAVDRSDGEVTFYPSETRGHGTLDANIGDERSEIEPIQVPSITLERLFAEYAPESGVDFLKVDVEGWEAQVLASAEWTHVRPRIVLVEAVDSDGAPTHEEWEETLLVASYRFGLFDGLNRFYCREEDADELLPRLQAPANVLDNWRPAREVQNEAALEARTVELHAALEAEKNAHLNARLAAAAEKEAHAETRMALAAEHTAHAETRGALVAEQGEHADTRAAFAAEQAIHANTRATLTDVLTSTSWRVTAPLRDVRLLLKMMRREPP